MKPEAAPPRTSAGMARRVAGVLGGLLAAVAIYYFVNRLLSQANQSVFPGPVHSLLWALALGVAVYLVAMIPAVAAWHRAVSGLSAAGSLSASAHVFLISQFAKYIPGNVAQFVGRFALGRMAGYPSAAILAAMALETVAVIWVTLALGSLVAFEAAGAMFDLSGPNEVRVIAMGGALVVATLALPLVLLGLDRLKLRLRPLAGFRMPTWRTATVCAGLYCVTFFFLGLVVVGLASVAYGARSEAPAVVLGVVAWAWLAGYVTPGAPAGVGVREVAMTAGLTGLYGESTALGVVLLFRVVTTIGDGLALIGGLLIRRMARPVDPTGSEPAAGPR